MPIVAGQVFDPQGDGTPDYKDYVDRAFDGNPDSAWLTWVYKQQFPTLKTGVGLMLELERETTPTSVTVNSATNGTVVEVRSATSPTPTLDQTKVLGHRNGDQRRRRHPADRRPEVEVPVACSSPRCSPTPDNQFQSKINEVTVRAAEPATVPVAAAGIFVGPMGWR